MEHSRAPSPDTVRHPRLHHRGELPRTRVSVRILASARHRRQRSQLDSEYRCLHQRPASAANTRAGSGYGSDRPASPQFTAHHLSGIAHHRQSQLVSPWSTSRVETIIDRETHRNGYPVNRPTKPQHRPCAPPARYRQALGLHLDVTHRCAHSPRNNDTGNDILAIFSRPG